MASESGHRTCPVFSATSVMTVGLAHANIVTVKQGAGFILGAKVGTTVTASCLPFQASVKVVST